MIMIVPRRGLARQRHHVGSRYIQIGSHTRNDQSAKSLGNNKWNT